MFRLYKLPLLMLPLLAYAPYAFAAGEAPPVWRAKCQTCHGLDGRAKTKVGEKEQIADFSSTDWQKKHSDDDILNVIAEGSKNKPRMKGYRKYLTDEEMRDLVQFIRGLTQT